jgi:hypothetical protein
VIQSNFPHTEPLQYCAAANVSFVICIVVLHIPLFAGCLCVGTGSSIFNLDRIGRWAVFETICSPRGQFWGGAFGRNARPRQGRQGPGRAGRGLVRTQVRHLASCCGQFHIGLCGCMRYHGCKRYEEKSVGSAMLAVRWIWCNVSVQGHFFLFYLPSPILLLLLLIVALSGCCFP